MVKTIVFCSLCALVFAPFLYAQASSSALPFLLITPSPELTAMGGVGVALPNQSATNFHANPAQLGWSAQTSTLALCFPSTLDLNGIFTSIPYRGFAARIGYNADSVGLPMSFGIGLQHQNVVLGTFTRTNDSGRVLGTFTSEESATTIGVGAVYHLPSVEIAAGVAIKPVTSALRPIAFLNVPPSTTTAFDAGILLCYTPFSHIQTGIFHSVATLSVGYTIANMGKSLVYSFEGTYPLPRHERLGYALQTATTVSIKGKQIPLLSLDWSAEALHALVRRDSLGDSHSIALFSDFNVAESVLLLQAAQRVDVRYGFRATLADILAYSMGNNQVSPWQDSPTSGYSLQLRGIVRALNLLLQKPALEYIAQHFDVQFHHSSESIFSDDRQRSFYSLSLMARDIRFF